MIKMLAARRAHIEHLGDKPKHIGHKEIRWS